MTERKKLISVVVPVYNEKENLEELYRRTTEVMSSLEKYDYEIVLFDDGSTDGSREIIEALCERDSHIKAIFYSRNFGYTKSVFYCVKEAKGDCAILLHADMQNPPELIPELVKKWENGAKNVLGIKNKSRENPIKYFMRTVVYWFFNHLLGVALIPHATEFELLDRSFIDILKNGKFKNPFLRGLIIQYATDIDYLYYTQDKREKGKTHFDINQAYDFAMSGVVSMSKILPRKMFTFGRIMTAICVLEFIIGFIPHAVKHTIADVGTALIVRFIFLAVSVGIMFTALMFEYIVSLRANSDDVPLITEEKRINY